jgi:hypothetical protein
MSAKREKPKYTAAQVKEHIKNIQLLNEKAKKESGHKDFIAITPEQIKEKLKSVNSPLFTGVSYSGPVAPGGTIYYNVSIYNPDPINQIHMKVHAWVGSGFVDPVIGTYLLNVDTRFPRMTGPQNWFNLSPSTGGMVSFNYKIPSTVEKTTYLLNAALMKIEPLGTGILWARTVFPIQVV